MKKLLLLGVAVSLALPAVAEMDSHAITLKWKYDQAALTDGMANMRGGTVVDGVFYIPNVATKKIEKWGENGKIGDLAVDGTPMACFNISRDDAGNLIISMRDWAAAPGISTGFAAPNGKLFLTNADGSKKATVDSNGALPSTRCDFFGTTRGDVFGDAATIYVAGATSYQFDFSELSFANGEIDTKMSASYTVAGDDFPDGINNNKVMRTAGLDGTPGDGNQTQMVSTTSVLCGSDVIGSDQFAALLTHVNVTSEYANNNAFCDGEKGMGNSVFQMLWSDDEETYLFTNKFYRMPQHNGCAGFSFFECAGHKFILYPAGSNNNDGWAIAEISLADTPQSDKDDAEYLVCRKWADEAEDGSPKYTKAPTGGGVWLFAEPSGKENVMNVYQYTPGSYIACFEVDLNKWLTGETGSVEGVVSDLDNVEVCGGKGFISVNGGEVSIYTVGGALVAKTSENVNVAPGIYVANTGKRTVKVVVK